MKQKKKRKILFNCIKLIYFSKFSKTWVIIVVPNKSESVFSSLILFIKPIPFAYHSLDVMLISIEPISLSPINFVFPIPFTNKQFSNLPKGVFTISFFDII